MPLWERPWPRLAEPGSTRHPRTIPTEIRSLARFATKHHQRTLDACEPQAPRHYDEAVAPSGTALSRHLHHPAATRLFPGPGSGKHRRCHAFIQTGVGRFQVAVLGAHARSLARPGRTGSPGIPVAKCRTCQDTGLAGTSEASSAVGEIVPRPRTPCGGEFAGCGVLHHWKSGARRTCGPGDRLPVLGLRLARLP